MTMEPSPARTELRARVYKLLSDCYQSPDAEFPKRIRELFGLLKALHPDIGLEVPDMPDGLDVLDDMVDQDGIDVPAGAETGSCLEQLKIEHARLFVGPFSLPVPPYGSMYLDPGQHLMAESTQDVQRWYLAEGIETAIKDVPDHICVELEFLYLLTYRELRALEITDWRGGAITEHDAVRVKTSGHQKDDERADSADPAFYRDKQRRFLEQHLGRWIPAFEKKVQENTLQGHAVSVPYRVLAAATRWFIAADLKELHRNIPE